MCPLCAIFTLNALKYHVYMCIQAADDASLRIQKSAVCCCLLGVSGLMLHQLLLDKLSTSEQEVDSCCGQCRL